MDVNKSESSNKESINGHLMPSSAKSPKKSNIGAIGRGILLRTSLSPTISSPGDVSRSPTKLINNNSMEFDSGVMLESTQTKVVVSPKFVELFSPTKRNLPSVESPVSVNDSLTLQMTSIQDTNVSSSPVFTDPSSLKNNMDKDEFINGLPDVLINGTASHLVQPVLFSSDARLLPHIQNYFIKNKISNLLSTQCHTIPGIIDKHNVGIIAGPKKGKSTAVILAILQRILLHKKRLADESIAVRHHPKFTFYYVCSTWRKAQKCHDIFMNALQSSCNIAGSTPSVRVALIYGGQQEQNALTRLWEMSSSQPCDICFATPPPLLRLAEGSQTQGSCISIHYTLAGLVLDDLAELCREDAFLPEIQRLLILRQQALVILSHRAEDLLDITVKKEQTHHKYNLSVNERKQIVMTCSKWTRHVKSFVERHMSEDSVFLWQSPMEIVNASGIRQKFAVSDDGTDEQKIICLQKILKKDDLVEKMGIIWVNDLHDCQLSVKVCQLVGKCLNGHRTLLMNATMSLSKWQGVLSYLRQLIRENNRNIILVISDEMLKYLNELLPLGSAKFVIHWNMPKSLEDLSHRWLVSMRESLLAESISEQPLSYFLCNESPSWWIHENSILNEYLTKLQDFFMHYHTKIKLPSSFEEAIVALKIERMKNMGPSPLCTHIKTFGRCRSIDCKARHEVIHGLDAPSIEDSQLIWPLTGEIEFRVLSILSPNRYFVNLLSHRIGNTRYDYPRLLPILAMKLNTHFAKVRNDVPLKRDLVQVGAVVAWRCRIRDALLSVDVFHRCEIIRVSTQSVVSIRLLDSNGGDEHHGVDIKELRELPEDLSLSHYPPQAVEVILLNVKPVDNDEDYFSETCNAVKKILMEEGILFATVALSLRGTIWVNDFYKYVRVNNHSVKLRNYFLVRELIQQSLASRDTQHFKRLLSLCKGEVTIFSHTNNSLPVTKDTSLLAPEAVETATSSSSCASLISLNKVLAQRFTYPSDFYSGNNEKTPRKAALIPPSPWKSGESYRCVLTHWVSPQECYFSFEETWDDLWDLIEALGKHNSCFRPYSISSPSLANSSGETAFEDPYLAVGLTKENTSEVQWFRGLFITILRCDERQFVDLDEVDVDLSIHIYLIDFGETVCLPKREALLKQLPCEFRTLPIQAKRCSLAQGFDHPSIPRLDFQTVSGHRPYQHDLHSALNDYFQHADCASNTNVFCIQGDFLGVDNETVKVKVSQGWQEAVFTDKDSFLDMGEYLICFGAGQSGQHYCRAALAEELFPLPNRTSSPVSLTVLSPQEAIVYTAYQLIIAENEEMEIELAIRLRRFYSEISLDMIHLSIDQCQIYVSILIKLAKFLSRTSVLNYIYQCLLFFSPSHDKATPVLIQAVHSLFNEDKMMLCIFIRYWHMTALASQIEYLTVVTQILMNFDFFLVESLSRLKCLPSMFGEALSVPFDNKELLHNILNVVSRFAMFFPKEMQLLLPIFINALRIYNEEETLTWIMEIITNLLKGVEHKKPLEEMFHLFWSHSLYHIDRGILNSKNGVSEKFAAVVSQFWKGQHVSSSYFLSNEVKTTELKSVIKRVESVELRQWYTEMLREVSWKVKEVKLQENISPALPETLPQFNKSKNVEDHSEITFVVSLLKDQPHPFNPTTGMEIQRDMNIKWSQNYNWIFLIIQLQNLSSLVMGDFCPLQATSDSMHFRLILPDNGRVGFDFSLWGNITDRLIESPKDSSAFSVKCNKRDIRSRIPKATSGLWPSLLQDGSQKPNFLTADLDRIHLTYHEEWLNWHPDDLHFLPPVQSKTSLVLTELPEGDVNDWIKRGRPLEPESISTSSDEEDECVSFRQSAADEGVHYHFGVL